jgi:hypothetical protein
LFSGTNSVFLLSMALFLVDFWCILRWRHKNLVFFLFCFVLWVCIKLLTLWLLGFCFWLCGQLGLFWSFLLPLSKKKKVVGFIVLTCQIWDTPFLSSYQDGAFDGELFSFSVFLSNFDFFCWE